MPHSERSFDSRHAPAHSGLEFESEDALVLLFQRVFSPSAGGTWRWIREFATSGGRADLVGVQLSPDWRSKSALGNVAPRWAFALRSLPAAIPFSLLSFSELANVSISTARNVLRRFQEANFCQQLSDSGLWIKTVEPEAPVLKIVAVEAKLRDWRRALYQAVQHADYATHSWVILDHSALRAAKPHAHEFRMRGVGLAGLLSDGEAEIAAHAPEKAPRSLHRLWYAYAEIARQLA